MLRQQTFVASRDDVPLRCAHPSPPSSWYRGFPPPSVDDTQHTKTKGRLSAAQRELHERLRGDGTQRPGSESGRTASPPNINGLVGLLSGSMMSRVAPVRSACCSVPSPICSLSPTRTR